MPGDSYVVGPLGIFSFVYVPSVLFVRGDAAATSRNIVASGRFRSGIVSHVISQITVPFLALAMYRLIKHVNKEHAAVMAVLALLCVPISVLTEVNHLAALRLLHNAGDGAFTTTQLQTQAMLFLDMRQSGVLLAQVFWGLWLLVVGSLVFRSGFLPRWLGVAVLIGAAGYSHFDSGVHLMFAGRATVSQFTALGELMLPVWLLVEGGIGRTVARARGCVGAGRPNTAGPPLVAESSTLSIMASRDNRASTPAGSDPASPMRSRSTRRRSRSGSCVPPVRAAST